MRKGSSYGSPLMQQTGAAGRGDQPAPTDGRDGGSRSRSPSKKDSESPQSPHSTPTATKRKSTINAGRRSTTNSSGLVVPLELAFNQAMELRAKAILSACMLIGFVDFLADGDLNYLSVEDRRDWTRHILKAVKVGYLLPILSLTNIYPHENMPISLRTPPLPPCMVTTLPP